MTLNNLQNIFIHITQIGKNNGQLVIRKSANINTNMYIESFHRILKHLYMKAKANRRIDNLIHVLLKVSRDKGFETL